MKMKITVEIENADGLMQSLPLKNTLARCQKKITTKAEGRDGVTVNEDDSRYKLDTGIGRMDVVTHRAANGDRTVFNAKVDVFPKIGPNERYRSSCYDNLELRLVTFMSYRKTVEVMNHLRWQDDVDLIKSRTLADAVVREGAKITDYMEAKAKKVLIQHQFDEKSGKPKELHVLETAVECSKIPTFPADEVSKVIDEYNEGKEKDRQIDATQIDEVFENPACSVNISVDDVGVTEQKANGRCKGSVPKESKHYVQNTVIHIQQGLNKYLLDGLGIGKTLILLTSFLLHNDLLTNKTLMFFTDGAVDIKNAIKDVYGWRPYQIILDWYHLKKKCKEQLSMALKGREIRNDVLKQALA
ncbi:MAG: hypothetical protein WA125_03065, partial [Desulfosporosinus sp.]